MLRPSSQPPLLLVLFALLLSTLVHTSVTERQSRPLVERDEEFKIYEEDVLLKREAPATTTSSDCPDADALFYVTSHNYTWQIQCVTAYEGSMISTNPSLSNFSACIEECAQFNHDNFTGTPFCHGVTFNGPADDGTGTCNLWAKVDTLLLADEEGLVEDSALLIYGPTGFQYATTELPPAVPSYTPINVVSPAPTSPTTDGPGKSTVVETSTVIITICGPDVTDCPGISTPPSPSSSTSTTSPNSSPISIASSTGSGPATSTTSPTVAPTAISATLTGSVAQMTYTTIVSTTELRLQPLVFCTSTPVSTCQTTTETSTITGSRTEVYCSPAPCLGIGVLTGMVMGMASTDICIASF